MDASACENVTDAPSAQQYFKEIDTATLVVTCIAILLAVGTVVMGSVHKYMIAKYISRQTRKESCFWLAGLLPVAAVASATAACVPRCINSMNVFILLYFARCMFTFWALVRDLFGGKLAMSQTLRNKDLKINFRSPPCGCCLFCLHPAEATTKNLNKVRRLAVQVAIVRPTLLFISAVNVSNGRGEGVPIIESVSSIINLISTMLSMYGLMMLTALAKDALKQYRIKLAFHILQFILVTYSLQGAIFNILADNHIISCDNVLPAKIRAEVWNHLLLTLEVFLLSLAVTLTMGPSKNAIFDKHPSNSAVKQEIGTESQELVEAKP